MNQRTKRRVDTGFRSLRELLVCAVGAGGFWVLVTRFPHPDRFALGACVVLMAVPSLASIYRIINVIYGAGGRMLREAERQAEEEDR